MELQVLIVDNETFLAEETAAALDFMGVPTVTAGSAREAISILEAHHDIGVLVSDVRMPQENGMDLARHVLADRDDSRAVDVILMTGCFTDIDVTGIAGCIGKPFLVEDLAVMVQKSIGAVGLRRSSQRAPACGWLLPDSAGRSDEVSSGHDPLVYDTVRYSLLERFFHNLL